MVRLIDDAELLRLAAEPPRDVAPTLRRAQWFLPLVLLLAVAPPLVVAARAPFDEETACWGLRALWVRYAERLTEWLGPETGWPAVPMNWAPPLQSWLTAPMLACWPPGNVTPLIALACVCVMASIGLVYRFADEIGGSRQALLSAICLALHPQLLMLVQTGAPDALSFLLLVIVAWGLWGHLNGGTDWVSFRLMIAGVAWGLLLLAGGPLAIAFVAIAAIALVWSFARTEPPRRVGLAGIASRWRFGVSSLGILIFTGGALGCWWVAMMLAEYGSPFLRAWLIGLAGPQSLTLGNLLPSESFRQWLNRSVCLGGWWLVGLISAANLGGSRRSSPEALFARWLIVWTVSAALLRIVLLFARVEDSGAIRLWETFALLPATLLAAQGLDRVLRRDASWQLVLTALMVTLGHVFWMMTGRLSIGVIVGGSFGILILASAPLALGLRRSTLAWSETEVRRWVAAAAVGTLCGHACLSWQLTHTHNDRSVWRRVQQRLAAVSDVSQASLIESRQTNSAQLRYLVRAVWPHATLSQAAGWHPGLTETRIRGRDTSSAKMVIVEWTRQDLRLQGELGSGWQVTTVLEPEPYRGQRLTVHLLAPVKR